jgi:hypothetical protein
MMPCAGRLVRLIEQDAQQLAAAWLKDVKKNTKLPSYQILMTRIFSIVPSRCTVN